MGVGIPIIIEDRFCMGRLNFSHTPLSLFSLSLSAALPRTPLHKIRLQPALFPSPSPSSHFQFPVCCSSGDLPNLNLPTDQVDLGVFCTHCIPHCTFSTAHGRALPSWVHTFSFPTTHCTFCLPHTFAGGRSPLEHVALPCCTHGTFAPAFAMHFALRFCIFPLSCTHFCYVFPRILHVAFCFLRSSDWCLLLHTTCLPASGPIPSQ